MLTTEPTANPVVSPTAVVTAADGGLFVLDAGLRPFPTDRLAELTLARPAGVFRIDPSSSPASVRPVTKSGNLVFPTGMAIQAGRLLICDPGQPKSQGQNPVLSRLSPFQFCVVVHFEASTLPQEGQQRDRVLGRVTASILGVVDELRPAHTLGNLIITG
jgi:hypothetical protein